MLKIIAGLTRNNMGQQVFALHIPNRKNRVLLTGFQFNILRDPRRVTVLGERAYEDLRKRWRKAKRK